MIAEAKLLGVLPICTLPNCPLERECQFSSRTKSLRNSSEKKKKSTMVINEHFIKKMKTTFLEVTEILES